MARFANDLSIVDLGARKVLGTIPVGNAPRKIVVQPGAVGSPPAATATRGTPAAVSATAPAAPALASPAGAAGNTSITIANFAFDPPTLTVAPGQQVTWTNKDSVTHTVTSKEDGLDSGNLAVGASFSHTFARPGSVAYACAIHPFMRGMVVVK